MHAIVARCGGVTLTIGFNFAASKIQNLQQQLKDVVPGSEAENKVLTQIAAEGSISNNPQDWAASKEASDELHMRKIASEIAAYGRPLPTVNAPPDTTAQDEAVLQEQAAMQGPFAMAGLGVARFSHQSVQTQGAALEIGAQIQNGLAAHYAYSSAAGTLKSGGAGSPYEPINTKSSGVSASVVHPPERKPIPDDEMELLRANPDAHSFERHGGSVTDERLMIRARTGVAPDGSVKSAKNGTPIIPPMSSAFHSDQLLVYADQYVRNNGALAQAIARNPGESYVTVYPGDVGDVGVDLGRGYVRLGSGKFSPDLQGPLQLIGNLRSVQGTYAFNPVTGKWETVTLFPSK